MANHRADLDPSAWDPALDAVVAAPKHHKVIFENERLRVLEVTLEPNDEEPIHHHRWPSVFVFDQMAPALDQHWAQCALRSSRRKGGSSSTAAIVRSLSSTTMVACSLCRRAQIPY